MIDRRLEVDGEQFVVRDRGNGSYAYDWVSGPNVGYGFSGSTSDQSALGDDQIQIQIRTFLAMVDPTTGYIEDDPDDG